MAEIEDITSSYREMLLKSLKDPVEAMAYLLATARDLERDEDNPIYQGTFETALSDILIANGINSRFQDDLFSHTERVRLGVMSQDDFMEECRKRGLCKKDDINE